MPTNSQLVTATTGGFYSVVVTGANGCTGAASIIVIVNPAPTPVINGPTTACFLSTPLSTGSYSSYIWSNGATTQTTFAASGGTYRASVSNASGCTGMASIYILGQITLLPVITGPTSACTGTNIALGLTGTYTAYHWSTGASTPGITVSTSGTYSVTVYTGSCSEVGHTTITMLALPAPMITASNLTTYCNETASSTLSVGTFPNYHWSNNAVTQSIAVPANSPGTYSVTITGLNACTASTSIVMSTSCTLPTGLNTTAVTATTATTNWTQPVCQDGYIIRISKHGLNSWAPHTITATTHYAFSGLAHNTGYDWQIQTNCNASGSLHSTFSASVLFTTSSRMSGELADLESYSFKVYPNPTNDHVTVSFNAESEESYTFRLMDVTGRIILSENYTSVTGENQYQLNLFTIAKGVYTVILQNGNAVMQKKLVVQ